MYDVIIIGAGIIGTFIARELSKFKIKIAIIEKENDVSKGTTKGNTAIIHRGYDPPTGSNMAIFNALGHGLFEDICNDLEVDFKKIGSMVVAFNKDEMDAINKLYSRGLSNDIKDIEIIGNSRVRELEPNLNKDIIGALYAPTAGIIGPWELAIALAENAATNGVEILLNSKVIDIEKLSDRFCLITNNGAYDSKYIINCAGVYADEINNMVSKRKIKIIPKRGQYYILDKEVGSLVNSVIFQCPTLFGKGVVVAPTVHGNIIVGPTKETIKDKDGVETTSEGLNKLMTIAQRACSKVSLDRVITSFSGIRAEAETGDFIIEECSDVEGFINVAGIKSPGLTAAPAIAKYVESIIVKKFENPEKRKDFISKRKSIPKFSSVDNTERRELINKDSTFGNIVCRCEAVTEGEIIEAIRRSPGAVTLDGIKRRVRPGSGRCQGGFCSPRIIEILSREFGKKASEILKEDDGSYLLIEEEEILTSSINLDKGGLK